MQQFKPKFQIPKRSLELRGQLFPYLIDNFDTKVIESKDQIEQDRILTFSHPFCDWVFDALQNNKELNFFHLDNGYVGNWNYKRPMYYRISYNSLQNTKPGPIKKSRIHTLELDDRYQDWNDKGEYNLLVMPRNTNIFKYLGQDYDEWREQTIAHYQNLDVPLVIREKTGKRRHRFAEIIPMMHKAKKVITYHSMAVVEALCLGKPIEVLGQSAVEHWQGQFGFDRTPMLEHIAHSQFSREEYENGTAWEVTFNYQVANGL